MPPPRIGRYDIFARIATGGMAEVFLGRATGEAGFERLVAVKRILPHLAANENFVAMFIDEARITAGLQHSNIGQIFEFDKVDETYFYAMEYIQGVSLTRICSVPDDKGLSFTLVAHIMASVCAALEHAHTRCDTEGRSLGIIHRDVNPKNIMVSFEGEVKLIDFGLARAAQRLHDTAPETIKGKFAYMSPEQAYGKPLDHRTDIFSAGIVLFEMLTHLNPFDADSDLGTLEKVRKADMIRPRSLMAEIPEELEEIFTRALARDPEERYASAGQMQADLERVCFAAGHGRLQLTEWVAGVLQEDKAQAQEALRQVGRIPRPTGDAVRPTGSHAVLAVEPEKKRSWAPLVVVAAICLALAMVGGYLLRAHFGGPSLSGQQPDAGLRAAAPPEPVTETLPQEKSKGPAPEEKAPEKAPAKTPAKVAPSPDRTPEKARVRRPRMASIHVLVRAHGKAARAELFLNGRKLGNAPGQHRIKPGTHMIRAHMVGFAPMDRQIIVRPGEQQKLILEFRR